jgi:RNA polymerase sigma factor (sigma-70 family)
MPPSVEDMDRKTDRLFVELKAGKPGARDALFKHLSERFSWFARHKGVRSEDDLKDIVQVASMGVLKGLEAGEEIEKPASYIRKIVSNKVDEYWRRVGKDKPRRSEIDPDSLTGPTNQPDPLLVRRLLDCLKQMIRRYPLYARILNLTHHEYNAPEISQRLNIKVSTTYVHLTRARAKMKKCKEKGSI